jgi:hypothetical protein
MLAIQQAEEVVHNCRAALRAKLLPLLRATSDGRSEGSGEWNRSQIAELVLEAPCPADYTRPRLYAASLGLVAEPIICGEAKGGEAEADVISSPSHAAAASDDVTADAVTISCRDPLSMQAIAIPVRGILCRHVQPFDLDTFLVASERAARAPWDVVGAEAAGPEPEPSSDSRRAARCPVCAQPTLIEDLYVDKYLREHFGRLASARPLRLSLCLQTGAITVAATLETDSPPDKKSSARRSKPAGGSMPPPSPGTGNKSPPPSRKRPRGMEVEGIRLELDDEA